MCIYSNFLKDNIFIILIFLFNNNIFYFMFINLCIYLSYFIFKNFNFNIYSILHYFLDLYKYTVYVYWSFPKKNNNNHLCEF